MPRKILFWSTLTMFVGAVTVYALVTRPRTAHQSTTIAVRPAPERVRAGALWPQLRGYLKAFGDRLEKPGKERLALSGTLDLAGEQSVQFTAISQFPNRLHLAATQRGQARTITCDGQLTCIATDTLNNSDQSLIDALVNDSVERFFSLQTQGAPTFHLGDRFRADDGSTEKYTGPYHDVFSLRETIGIGSDRGAISKLYYFNSDTQLLEKVTYQISRNGQVFDVETQFHDWQRIQDQQVVGRIVRLENGQKVLSLTITSTTLGPRLNDWF